MKTRVVPDSEHGRFPLDFWLKYLKVNYEETFNPDGSIVTSIEVQLGLWMDGQELSGMKRVHFSEDARLSPSQENDGPFDLMKGLCHDLVIQRWPELKKTLDNAIIGDLCLHAVSNGSTKYITAVWQTLLGTTPDGKIKEFAVQCESQSTIRAVVVALVKAYEVILKRYFKQKIALAKDAARRAKTPPRPPRKRARK